MLAYQIETLIIMVSNYLAIFGIRTTNTFQLPCLDEYDMLVV